jgi:hypothetical protein
LDASVNKGYDGIRNIEKEAKMLNILSNSIQTAARQISAMTPLGDNERRRLYLEQIRRERRAAQAKNKRGG